MDFSRRTNKPELLDFPGIPAADIQRNLYELSVINQKLGGHRVSLEGFRRLKGNHKNLVICEIGCGGGDNLKAIEEESIRQNLHISIIGIDMNPDCLDVAKKINWQSPVEFILSDYRNVRFEKKPDIIYSSLFCHHFTDADLIGMFHWMKQHSTKGFFVNDLHRHALAYYSIRLLTRFFSRSYLVKNDAPLSVRRGFRKTDLDELFRQAGMTNYSIRWKWAFRWLVIVPS